MQPASPEEVLGKVKLAQLRFYNYEEASASWLQAKPDDWPFFRPEVNVKNLLYYRLPLSAEEATESTRNLLRFMKDRTLQVSLLIGPSGCGKTRTAFEYACLRPSVYWVMDRANNGGQTATDEFCRDVKEATGKTNEPGILDTFVSRYALALLAAFLAVRKVYFEQRPDFDERDWLMCQLRTPQTDQGEAAFLLQGDPPIFWLYERFKTLDRTQLTALVRRLLRETKVRTLIVDEAQVLQLLGAGRFQSPGSAEVKRAAFTGLLTAFKPLSELKLVFAGTGFGMREAAAAASSAVGKPGPKEDDFVFAEFGRFDDLERWRSYVNGIVRPPLPPEECQRVFDVLQGRYRFTTFWLDNFGRSGNVQASLSAAVEDLTNPEINRGITRKLAEYLAGRNSDDVRNVLIQAKKILTASLVLGPSLVTVGQRHAKALMEQLDRALVSLRRDEHDNLQPQLGEPLVEMALVRFFAQQPSLAVGPLAQDLLDFIASCRYDSASMGKSFELLMAPVLALYVKASRAEFPLHNPDWPAPTWLDSLTTGMTFWYGHARPQHGLDLSDCVVVRSVLQQDTSTLLLPVKEAGPDQVVLGEDATGRRHLVSAQFRLRDQFQPGQLRAAVRALDPVSMFLQKKKEGDQPAIFVETVRTERARKCLAELQLEKQALALVVDWRSRPDSPQLKAAREDNKKQLEGSGSYYVLLNPDTCPKLFDPWLQAVGLSDGLTSKALWAWLAKLKLPE